MSLLTILVISFIVLTIIGKFLNLIKWFITLGLIILIGVPFLISSSLTSPKVIENLTANKVEIVKSEEVNTFKIRPEFENKNLINLSLEDLKKGPEKVIIIYNPKNIEKIPGEIQKIIDESIEKVATE